MSNKKQKKRTQFTSTLDADLYDLLKEASEKTGIPMSKILDEAVSTVLEANKIRE
ncbi:ribbon-helix-helix domain-containing protein [Bacillus phage vB_BauM_KLEB27-3]|nr:ribbon-helix-helix domain-containing protein [Bacillus phage vB_BauM_KLEB27-3]